MNTPYSDTAFSIQPNEPPVCLTIITTMSTMSTMTSNEQAFMRFDSISENSQDDASGDSDNKIMPYLQQGFEMMMFCECKTCNTPLIKKKADSEEKGWFGKKKHEAGQPVNCVPFCVECESIVVTTNEELQVIWKDEYKHLMAEKGAVTLAIEVTSKDYLLALSVAQGRISAHEEEKEEAQDFFSKAPKTASPTRTAKYENSNGLLVVVEDDDETLIVVAMEEACLERQCVSDNVDIVEVELGESPEEFDFELIEYKKRCV